MIVRQSLPAPGNGQNPLPPCHPEPGAVDTEPAWMIGTYPEPVSGNDSSWHDTLAIRTWSGLEPESISDAQLPASPGLDYPGIDIPSWVMTELGTLAARGDVTVGRFRTALEYVLGNA